MAANAVQLKWRQEEMLEKLFGETFKAWRAINKQSRQRVIARISKPGAVRGIGGSAHGRTRIITMFRPSQPGEPPHSVTGHLKSHIAGGTRRDRKNNTIAFTVRSRSPHAHLLELGTVKARPRPFLRPEFDLVGPQLLEAIKL